MNHFRNYALIRGFSMIEVLIALVVLTIGLLAIARLQLGLLASNNGSFLRGQAAIVANDLVDRIHANKDPSSVDAYLLPNPAVPPTNPGFDCRTTACATSTAMTQSDLYQWYTQAQKSMPSLKAKVVNAGIPPVKTITVMWNEPDQPASAVGTTCDGDFQNSLFCFNLSVLP